MVDFPSSGSQTASHDVLGPLISGIFTLTLHVSLNVLKLCHFMLIYITLAFHEVLSPPMHQMGHVFDFTKLSGVLWSFTVKSL